MILIIAVNYYSATVVPEFVRSLVRQENPAWRCLIVDNGDTSGGEKILAGLEVEDKRIRIVRSGWNLGYFGAARCGLDQWYADRDHLPEWILVSNVDIRLSDSNFFDVLATVESDIVAPSIVSPSSGRDENPHLVDRPTELQVARGARINRHYVLGQLVRLYGEVVAVRRSRKTAPPQFGERPIYAPHGSLICFSRRYFLAGGTLDHGVFLYGEEISVAEQARAIGATVTYVPRLRAEHSRHVSTGVLQSRAVAAYSRDASEYVRALIGSGAASSCCDALKGSGRATGQVS